VFESIGVGAGRFLGVRRNLAQIPQVCPKNTPKKMTSKKQYDSISSHVGCIFSNQSTSSIIFAQISPKLAQISPNLPEKN